MLQISIFIYLRHGRHRLRSSAKAPQLGRVKLQGLCMVSEPLGGGDVGMANSAGVRACELLRRQ